jgi:hypothetical protein
MALSTFNKENTILVFKYVFWQVMLNKQVLYCGKDLEDPRLAIK